VLIKGEEKEGRKEKRKAEFISQKRRGRGMIQRISTGEGM